MKLNTMHRLNKDRKNNLWGKILVKLTNIYLKICKFIKWLSLTTTLILVPIFIFFIVYYVFFNFNPVRALVLCVCLWVSIDSNSKLQRCSVLKKKSESSVLGFIVDQPFEEFKNQVEKQKVSIGINNNLILMLSATYQDLRQRKEAVLDLVFTGKKTKEEVKPVLESLYAEMVKLELKIVHLKHRSKDLLDLDSTTS